MGNGICNQEVGGYIKTKQNAKTYENRGDIGDRSSNLVKLIGAERVARRNYKYEGTYYVTEDGELYDKEYVTNHKIHNEKRRKQPRIQRKNIHFKKDWNKLHKQKHTQKTQIPGLWSDQARVIRCHVHAIIIE